MIRAGKGGSCEKEVDGKGKANGPLSTSSSTTPAPTPPSVNGQDASSGTVSASIPEPTPSYEPPSTQTPGAFNLDPIPNTNTNINPHSQVTTEPTPSSKILANTKIYINGQTTPLISDHKLKSLLVSHGATLSLSLSRRITHVIIGKPNQGPGRGGAGGGLAAGKIQRENSRGGWRGVRVVGVEWVLESIKAGKRLPETRFAVNLSGQRSVLGFM
ncbi:hypothetical protein BDV06DRAFT_221188 [Aspergillus oleicola]